MANYIIFGIVAALFILVVALGIKNRILRRKNKLNGCGGGCSGCSGCH